RDGSLSAVKGPAQVDAKNLIPGFGCVIQERLEVLVSGVVNQRGDVAEGIAGALEHGAHSPRFSDVSPDGNGLPAIRHDFGCRLLRAFPVDIVDDHFAAFSGESQRYRPANA